ncbi:RE1 [Symbiodinium sp. CCMP2592]|nr:RE1 [Symbiodinium sp. CCMP2592]
MGARPGPAVPADVLTKAFSEFLTKPFGGSAWLADVKPDDLQQFAGAAWALDSGASQFCIMGDNADDAVWETMQSADCDIDTGAGTARPTAMVDAMAPHLGRRSAMVMPDSKINMASMGETCAELGYHFYWPAWSEPPHFWRDGVSSEVPLTMVNRVPFLLSAVDAGPARLIEAASDTNLNDFFAHMFREFCLTLGETELANLSVPLALATQSQPADQHCLAHYPKDPTCEVCLQAKMCRAPAARKKQAVEDDKQFEFTGNAFTVILSALHASEAAAAFDDMYGNQSVSSVRTDNGGEFQGEFAAKLKERKIRHERSLPRQPQTNSRAERFHRTVAEGMACLFVASGVPYAFWTFCLMAFHFVYARSPGAGGADSPYQIRFNRSYDLSKLRPFGSACYYLPEEHEKFASRGRLGVVLGYSRLQSYYVLDFEHYVETKGEARIVHTHDARFPPQVRWPFHELGMDNPDAAYWAQRLFEPEVLQPTPAAGDDGRCVLCGLWATDADIHCRGCLLGGGRRRHVDGPGCLRARCGGHAFLDVQPPPDSPETSMDYSPSTPRSRDGGVIDSSMDSSSSRFSTSHDAHDDDDMGPPPDDEGDGRCHTDASPRRPRWRADLFADAQMLPPILHLHPGDLGPTAGRIHRMRIRPASSSHNRTSTEVRPDGIHSSDADSERSQQPTNDLDNAAISSTVTFESDRSGLSTVVRGGTVLTTPAALRLEQELDKLTTELGKMFACVTKIVKRRDPEWDTNAAREAIRKEAANHASKRTWEFEACEWETAVAKYGPDVEHVQANLILESKHYELDQSQHRFKARIVALGDNVRDIYCRLVEEDQLHGRPITLEGSRALDCYAGLQPDGDCQTADADGAYLQARLKDRPKVICLPREFRTQSELEMCCPVHLLYMAIYGLTRSNSDWEDHADEYNGHIVGMGRFVDDFKLEILSRDHADVATFLVKQDAHIDTPTRKYMDEIGAYRLPRYDTPAVKLAANDVSNMSETGTVALRSHLLSGGWVGATALSAPDAEVTAMAEGLKRHGIYAQDLFEFLLGYRVPLDIMTDSATGIAAIDDAYGVLKYMKRTQGVPLSRLHDVSMDPDNNINKTSTDDNLADVMTKALEKNKFQHFHGSWEFTRMVEIDMLCSSQHG